MNTEKMSLDEMRRSKAMELAIQHWPSLGIKLPITSTSSYPSLRETATIIYEFLKGE